MLLGSFGLFMTLFLLFLLILIVGLIVAGMFLPMFSIIGALSQ